MGKEMDIWVRQIATNLSVKRGERYSDTVGFVRRRIRFDLIRTCVKVDCTPARRLSPAFSFASNTQGKRDQVTRAPARVRMVNL